MTLDQIISAERIGEKAVKTAKEWAYTGEARDSLSRVSFILQEARHFAVTWQDQREQEDLHGIDAIQARNLREAAINRLVTAIAPDRF